MGWSGIFGVLYHTSVFTEILLVTKTLLPIIDSNCQYSKSQKLETLNPTSLVSAPPMSERLLDGAGAARKDTLFFLVIHF